MRHLERGVGHEGYLLLVSPLVLGQLSAQLFVACRLTIVLGTRLLGIATRTVATETLVGLLEERYVVVQFLHVELGVDISLTVVGDVVAKRRAVFKVGAAHPIVRSRIAGIGRNPVEYGQQIDRQLIRSLELLVVVERCAHVLD